MATHRAPLGYRPPLPLAILAVVLGLSFGCSKHEVPPTKPLPPPVLTSPRIAFDKAGSGPSVVSFHLFDPMTGREDNIMIGGTTAPEDPAISPDGMRIALSRVQTDPMRRRQIVTLAIDGTDSRSCTADSGYRDGAPRWSPDGKRLVFTRESFAGAGTDVYAVGTDGRGLVRLTQQGDARALDWSPDGTRILFQQYDGRQFTLATVATDGSDFRALLQDPYGVGAAEYSPSGSRIAFTRVYPASRLAVMDPDGSGIETLVDTTKVANVLGCSWSPDGMAIVISTIPDRGSGYIQLQIYRFGTADLVPLFSADRIARYNPDWGPKP